MNHAPPRRTGQIDVAVALLHAVPEPDQGGDEIRAPRQERYTRRLPADPDGQDLGHGHDEREDRHCAEKLLHDLFRREGERGRGGMWVLWARKAPASTASKFFRS